MAKRTSIIDRRSIRRGYTLVEAMLASVLLSVSVVAISGAISSSYAQESYARDRRAAMETGLQLLDEITSLPIDPKSAGQKSIMSYATYSDQTMAQESASVTSSTGTSNTQSVAADPDTETPMAIRKVTVKRLAALNGAQSSTGDFAIVGVDVVKNGEVVHIKRLVTAAEAQATR